MVPTAACLTFFAAALVLLGTRRRTGDQDEVEPIMMQHGLQLRRLHPSDFSKGYFEVLSQLTSATPVSAAAFRRRCHQLRRNKDHSVLVVEDLQSAQIIASATLLIEQKFIRGCGSVGHIEDVVVSAARRGQKLGHQLVKHLAEVSRKQGCYKVILDCSPDKQGFYESCNFQNKGVQMAMYF